MIVKDILNDLESGDRTMEFLKTKEEREEISELQGEAEFQERMAAFQTARQGNSFSGQLALAKAHADDMFEKIRRSILGKSL